MRQVSRNSFLAGIIALAMGAAIVQVNLLLPELAIIMGSSFVIDGEVTNYSPPGVLWIVPIVLLLIGVVSVIVGVATRSTTARHESEMFETRHSAPAK